MVDRPDQLTTLQRDPVMPVIGDVPASLETPIRSFLQSIKNYLTAHFDGRAGLDTVVTRRDIQHLGIDSKYLSPDTPAYDFTGGGDPPVAEDNPNPPTSLSVIKMIGANKLQWLNTESDTANIEGHQIWASNSNNISTATMVGFATWPLNQFVHTAVLPTVPWYYWIRSVKFNTLYSTWEPINAQGGLYVPSVTGATLNETVAALLQDDSYVTELKVVANAFKLIQPSELIDAWDDEATYDNVAIAANGTGKYYKSLQNDNLNHALLDTDWWEELPLSYFDDARPVFVVGTVNGVTTLALSGSIVADGSIISRNMAADSITGDHISATSLISLAGGGKLEIGSNGLIELKEGGQILVGNENIVIDSNTNSIRVAPDGGPATNNFAELGHDDIKHFYYDPTTQSHAEYASITRLEGGIADNNVEIEIPGLFKEAPFLTVVPLEIPTYDPASVTFKQTLRNESGAPTPSSLGPLRWKFTPTILLETAAGAIIESPPEAGPLTQRFDVYVWQVDPSPPPVEVYSTTYDTPPDTTDIRINGSLIVDAANRGGLVYLYVYVDGEEHQIMSDENVLGYWTVKSSNFVTSPNINKTFNVAFGKNMPEGTHTIRFRLVVHASNDLGGESVYFNGRWIVVYPQYNQITAKTQYTEISNIIAGGVVIQSGKVSWSAMGK